MCIYIRNFSSSTRCYKYATASVVVALCVHAAGLFTAHWSTHVMIDKITFRENIRFTGIWWSCICNGIGVHEKCVCDRNNGDAGIIMLCCFVL